MARTTHSARVTGPISYVASSGKPSRIPPGPCLVEQGDDHQADIIWGARGQNCATLAAEVLANAEDSGQLVLLD